MDRNEGFETAIRVNHFVEELVQANIELAKSYNFSGKLRKILDLSFVCVPNQANMYTMPSAVFPRYYPPSSKSLNGTNFSPEENFLHPLQNVSINGVSDTFSQRYADSCSPYNVSHVPSERPFAFSKIVVVGSGVCASACSAFTTIMQELHGVKIINFGAAKQAYSGMAGAEVLDWNGLDSEFKVSVPSTPSIPLC